MNFTEITTANLPKAAPTAQPFDNCKIGGGIDDGQIWLAVEFTPAGVGCGATFQGSPTQWLEFAHALYGVAGRLLELQQQENRRRELGLDLLPSVGA